MSSLPGATHANEPSTPTPGAAILAFGLDVILIVVFAITGRASHSEALDLTGAWATAWPFLAGLSLAWLATRAWRRPLGVVWPGIGIWVGSVAIGMLLRLATSDGTALPFVIVATITLAVFLLGWRGIAALVRRLRR